MQTTVFRIGTYFLYIHDSSIFHPRQYYAFISYENTHTHTKPKSNHDAKHDM